MSDDASPMCVLLPCSSTQCWAVPQRCLGEIVTVAADDDRPPAEIDWRGQVVPVMDFSGAEEEPWRDRRSGTGLVAVMLGHRGEPCRYWGVAVRGEGLGVTALEEDEMEDLPEAALEHATAAFRMGEVVYQIPDLLALQRSVGTGGLR